MELTTTNQEIEKLNPEQLTKHVLSLAYPVNVAQALNSKTDKLSTIKREYGKEFVLALLLKFIQEIASLSNKHVDKLINQRQAVILANDIFDNYYYMSCQEIRFAFMQGYKDQYHKDTRIFDTLEMKHFSNWLECYDKERTEHIETKPEYRIEQGLKQKQLPEPLSETDIEERKSRLNEMVRDMQRKNFEFKKRIEAEKKIKFDSLALYLDEMLDGTLEDYVEIKDSTFELITKKFEIPEVQKAFIDLDTGEPSEERFIEFCHKKMLSNLNILKPKKKEDILRIAFNSII